MPSVTYMNQSAPFWDFIASLEQGNSHPHSSQTRSGETAHDGSEPHEPTTPFDFGNWGGHLFGGLASPHRDSPLGRHGTPRERNAEESAEKDDEKSKESNAEMNDDKARNDNDNGEGPSGTSGYSDDEGWVGGRGRHGRCGAYNRRGHCGSGGYGRQWHHGGPHRGGPRPGGFGRRGGWGPWGHEGMFGGGFDPSALAAHFWNQFNESESSNSERKTKSVDNEDHNPDADVFDTENAFVVHVSLPGAKKEDVGVNWDTEKSELSVAGVIYRPGDEEFLKALSVNERKVGPFEKKIRLGTRATPAHIDVDGITAKLEDGILRVEVPKLDTGYVEIKKVDIE